MSENNEPTNSTPTEPNTEGTEGTPPSEAEGTSAPASLLPTSEKADEGSDDGGAEGEQPVEEFVPLTSEDVNFAEDLQVSDEVRDEFLDLINDQEMSVKDKAQALVDLQTRVAEAASEANSQAFVDLQKEWQDAVKADPVLGGGNFQKTISEIGKLAETYGDSEFLEAMAVTGAGNNLAVIRFLSKIAGVVNEGTPAHGSPSTQEGTAAQRLYPSMKG